MGAQMRPLPCVAMKLMTSGVALRAAVTKSPSFSRSSSSTTIITLPALISAMASSMVFSADFIGEQRYECFPQMAAEIQFESAVLSAREAGSYLLVGFQML